MIRENKITQMHKSFVNRVLSLSHYVISRFFDLTQLIAIALAKLLATATS